MSNSLTQVFPKTKIIALRQDLLQWFEENGRQSIAWKLRKDGTPPKAGEYVDPYPIWIAEIMLQQTQLKTVLPYWEKWMKTFPTLIELAHADEQKILLLWQGLGYYSRARRIHQASLILLDYIGSNNYNDPHAWPKDLVTWMSLPGIGRSTAASIISSAYDLPSPIMDGNVRRILARLTISIDSSAVNWKLIEILLDKKSPRKFNQAMMDIGSLVCTPSNPKCEVCPLIKYCHAFLSNQQHLFPVKENKKALTLNLIGIGIVLNDSGEVLIDQRLNEGLLGGMWEFPGGKQELGELIEETIQRELKEELAIEVEVGKKLISLNHSYSHMKLCFVVHLCRLIKGDPKPLASQKVKWVLPEQLNEYPFPAANARMIKALIDYLSRQA